MKYVIKFVSYFSPAWTGSDGKVSLRAIMAIFLCADFVRNLRFSVTKWDAGRSFEGLAMVLGIEASLIAALLALTTYQNVKSGISKTIETGEPPVKQTIEAKGDAVTQVEPLPPA
jgi:hypothetical protein